MTRCREGSRGEPLAGTAPRARWWWLIEVPGPWGRLPLTSCRVPAVRHLASDDTRRVLLVRRPGRHPARDPAAPLRLWVAGGMPGDPPIRSAVLDRPEDLLDWDPLHPPQERLVPDPNAPALLVCTNASRDPCCGLEGRALVNALADPRVMECSHLGGHRFAPTALDPHRGLVYGRLDVPAARTILDGGPVPVTYLRGRSALPPAAQAAEAHLLELGVEVDPRHARVTNDGDDAIVELGAPSGERQLRMRAVSGAARPLSCGGEPEGCTSWQATA